MFEHYVYVPFADEDCDPYAAALVAQKNRHNKVIGHHTLILRANQGNGAALPLSVVGTGDRLYVLLHGRLSLAGMGTATPAGGVRRDVRGEDVGATLVSQGLANKSISLRLWMCWSGGKLNETRDGMVAGDGNRTPFIARVAAALRRSGRTSVTVVGYRGLVDLDGANLAPGDGKKKLMPGPGDAGYHPAYRKQAMLHHVGAADRVKIDVSTVDETLIQNMVVIV